ncbi:MAG: putative metal-binding motif-containing protein [Pseudomonadota bacterium]|nr:putative metal-binding motif-containing protein [Pseudomonadota bacterium]
MLRTTLLLLLAACTGPADKPGDTDPDTGPPLDCERFLWHADVDGDGFGDAALPIEACEPPGTEVLDATDCDDANAAAYPGAPEDCTIAFDANCDGSSGYADADDDGTAACEDCDDANPSIHPGAAEFCDGLDSDCDDLVDEDAADGRLYYPDADGDSYGDLAGAARACEAPEGWGTNFSDCDDTTAAVSPSVAEACNGIDDDCDGSTDEGDATGALVYYDDVDLDGYGDETTPVRTCTPGAGAVTVGGDCEDLVATVNPGVAETCNGIDDDCSGVIDGAEAIDPATWYVDRDGDGWGDLAYPLASCDEPAGYVSVDGDCDDTVAAVSPDADETCDGTDDDCDGTVDEDDAVGAPTWYVDADLDGYGSGASAVVACEAPDTTGWSLLSTDCDDAGAPSPVTVETCNGVDDDCDGTIDEDDASDAPTWYGDFDGDGFGDASDPTRACAVPAGYEDDAHDCDDDDATVSPDGIELCDGVDDDCDGTVDEDAAVDAPTWYLDADLDGYGADAVGTDACSAPAGYVAAGGDCDDADEGFHPGAAEADCADPLDYNCDGSVGDADADADGWIACEDCDDAAGAVYPGAAETCNAVDDDCDDVVDNEGATGAGSWYADTDGDGYGDPAAIDRSCTLPAGFVTDATDCDDADAAVSPRGTEVCATAYDDDCDGDAAELRTRDCTRYYLDYDEDTYGSSTSVCACAAFDLFVADDSDDCDDGDPAANPGATETTGNGVDDDCDGIVDALVLTSADAVVAGDVAAAGGGYGLAGGADVDGDGYDDLLMGLYEDDQVDTDAGSAILVLGPVSGTVLAADADATLLGEAVSDFAGYAVALGDADGDGFGDALVGASGNGAGGREAGAAYLVQGPFSGTLDLGAADALLVGDSASDRAGVAVTFAGDVDGDGVGDLLVGAPGSDVGAASGGAVYLVLGPPAASVALASAEAELYGNARQDAAGGALAPAGDIDGDGLADFYVGVPEEDDTGSGSGSVYVFQGPVSGSLAIATNADVQIAGAAAGDAAGTSVAGPGDVDGDGYDDLLAGAPGAGTGGRAYLVLSLVGRMNFGDATAIFEADTADDAAGGAVAGPGDIDGDGVPDLVVGAFGSPTGGVDAGAAYFFGGGASGTLALSEADASWLGEPGDLAGIALAPAGDTDGDGLRDTFVGAYQSDAGAVDGGAGFLVRGQ